GRVQLADRPQRLQPVDVGHEDVEQDDVGQQAPTKGLEQRGAAGEDVHFVAAAPQQQRKVLGEGGIVVDEGEASGHEGAVSSGSVSSVVVPPACRRRTTSVEPSTSIAQVSPGASTPPISRIAASSTVPASSARSRPADALPSMSQAMPSGSSRSASAPAK